MTRRRKRAIGVSRGGPVTIRKPGEDPLTAPAYSTQEAARIVRAGQAQARRLRRKKARQRRYALQHPS